jgi:hypothetical protein
LGLAAGASGRDPGALSAAGNFMKRQDSECKQ